MHGLAVRTRAWLRAIDEPDVSLTDYALVVETACLAARLAWRPPRWSRLRGWGVAFFAATAVASLAGGTDHGFFRRAGRERAHDTMWATTLLAIGASSVSIAAVAAELGLPRTAARRVTAVAGMIGAGYAVAVLRGNREFRLAIRVYAPAAVFLLAVLVRRRIRHGDAPSLEGAVAVVLTFVAAAIQYREIGLHPRYLGHNALYHLVQGVAFALFYGALRGILAGPAPVSPASPPARRRRLV